MVSYLQAFRVTAVALVCPKVAWYIYIYTVCIIDKHRHIVLQSSNESACIKTAIYISTLLILCCNVHLYNVMSIITNHVDKLCRPFRYLRQSIFNPFLEDRRFFRPCFLRRL